MNEYRSAGMEGVVEEASPHLLVHMLLQGAMDKIAAAKGHMQAGDVALKGENVSKAISIIESLRVSLDREVGGELAANLNDLYDYMGRRLLEANARNEIAMLDEVAGLLGEIKSGWDAIPPEHREPQAR
jgi:flagellar protein FliS